MSVLNGKTFIITGGSRGIGREIALRCARDGANIVVAAKSDEPHPKLAGTIHTVAEEITAAGGNALAVKTDVRFEDQVDEMVELAAKTFGGIDGLINNAGAIGLTPLEKTPLKRFDLMHSINTRAVLLCSQAVIPHLIQVENPHIINLSPPINLDKKWLGPHIPYTVTKYGMSLLTLGMAEELQAYNIAVNSLWPQTVIATAAVEYEISADLLKHSRTPAIMADAAYEILTTENCALTGNTLIDETLLRDRGVTDFEQYANAPGNDLVPDLYVEPLD